MTQPAKPSRSETTSMIDEADGWTRRFHLGYRPALDGIRGISIVLIMLVHSTLFLVPEYAGMYVPGGFIAVDVFFVLSGFLITSILMHEWERRRTISLRKFYARRALRLFPALWAVMIVHLVYTLVMHDPLRHELRGLVVIFLYVGNYSWKFGVIAPDALGQTWSLAVEEQFYLVWPLALIALIRLRNRRVTIAAFWSLVVVAFVFRLVLWNVGVPWYKVYVQTGARFDTLMIGALFAYLLHTGWRPPRRISLYGAGGALFLAIVTATAHPEDGWRYNGGYTLIALASGLVILAALDHRSVMGRVLSVRPLRLLGRLSYSLYLWHVFVFIAVHRAAPTQSTLVRLLAGFGITGLASTFSFYVIESPFLRRKARLHPEERSSPGAIDRGLRTIEPSPTA
jgi:peptidoglycan/LPS O-acetylase OafA/YrhL